MLYGPGPLNFIRHLSVDDLPRKIDLSEIEINLEFLELRDGEMDISPENNSVLVSLFYSARFSGDGFLLFVNGFTLAVIYEIEHNSYFLFDSHSRNEHGFLVSDGKSVLIRFARIYDIECYIKEIYLHAQMTTCYFQIQFVKVHISDANRENLRQNFFVRQERQDLEPSRKQKRNKQQRLRRALSKGTDQYEQTKKTHNEKEKQRQAKSKGSLKAKLVQQKHNKQRRKRYASMKHTPQQHLRRERFNKIRKQHRAHLKDTVRAVSKTYKVKKPQCKVKLFKEHVQQGPYYVCVVCNRSLYLRSVLRYDESRYDPSLLNINTNIASFNGRLYICNTCDKKLRKKVRKSITRRSK